MKKQTKKLVLSKETLRSLTPDLSLVVGGTTSTNECPYTFDHTCGCGFSSGMETCLCQSNQIACPNPLTPAC